MDEVFENKKVLSGATPVARKVAVAKMNAGLSFAEIKEEFYEIIGIEEKLYGNIKDSLAAHIRRHGLDTKTLELFEEFVKVKEYNFNAYQVVLKHLHKVYVDINRQIRSLDIGAQYSMNFTAHQQEKENLETRLLNVEYLISKVNEFLTKMKDLGNTAYEMVMSGKKPDFDTWSDKALIQDALFEENKQFLKQALHHLDVLEKNNVKMTVMDLKMLLYHRQGARREKLYRQVEQWIIRIYYNLTTQEERDMVYEDICSFIEELVPQVGYISPVLIHFIMGEGYISERTKNLLIKLSPVIKRLGMASVVVTPLEGMLREQGELADGKIVAGLVSATPKGKADVSTVANIHEIIAAYRQN